MLGPHRSRLAELRFFEPAARPMAALRVTLYAVDMDRNPRPGVAAALILALLSAPPALARPPATPVEPTVAVPAVADCAAFAARRAALRAERETVRLAIADFALGRTHRRKPGAGAAGRAAGGAAASLLLPFGIGLAVNAAAALGSAGRKKKRKARPPAPEPDVPALIARQQAIEAELAGPAPSGCESNGVAAGR